MISAEAGSPPPPWLLRLAAGVDVGAGASIAVLLWFAVHSRLLGDPWWAKFNLAAAVIYGSEVYWMGRGRATLAGAALLFVLYTLLGVLFAFLAGRRSFWRSALLALLWMALWQMAAERHVWPLLDDAAPQYFNRLATVPAHLAAAILLMRYPSRLRRLEALFQPAPPTRPSGDAPAPEVAVVEAEPADAAASKEAEAPEPPGMPRSSAGGDHC
ncbi:MAG: hypothetical protein ACP5UT_02610 [Bryobacteraceae bacterium]